MNQMFCFRCDKELKSAVYQIVGDDKFYSQPGAGLEFITIGHYGSAFWDPMPDLSTNPASPKEYIVLYLCDQCLAGNEERIYYRTTTVAEKTVDNYVSGLETKLTRIIET